MTPMRGAGRDHQLTENGRMCQTSGDADGESFDYEYVNDDWEVRASPAIVRRFHGDSCEERIAGVRLAREIEADTDMAGKVSQDVLASVFSRAKPWHRASVHDITFANLREAERQDVLRHPYVVLHPSGADHGLPAPTFATWSDALAAQKAWNVDCPGHRARRRWLPPAVK